MRIVVKLSTVVRLISSNFSKQCEAIFRWDALDESSSSETGAGVFVVPFLGLHQSDDSCKRVCASPLH